MGDGMIEHTLGSCYVTARLQLDLPAPGAVRFTLECQVPLHEKRSFSSPRARQPFKVPDVLCIDWQCLARKRHILLVRQPLVRSAEPCLQRLDSGEDFVAQTAS